MKICGVCSVEDARICVDAGASAIGINFVPSSPRVVDITTARAIVDAVRASGASIELVGVVADMTLDAMRSLVLETSIDCLQLHGNEPPDVVASLLPKAYKAVRIGSREDVALAASYPGEYILVDAKTSGALGGTGTTFDWSLVTDLAKSRAVTLAGGLRPDNVAEAIRAVRPFCVDVASGVERAPRIKDAALVRQFVRNARSA